MVTQSIDLKSYIFFSRSELLLRDNHYTRIVLALSNSCALSSLGCNCDKDVSVWREDSGLLTDKTKLPVKRNNSILGILLGLKKAAIHGMALTYFSLNRLCASQNNLNRKPHDLKCV